MSLIQRLKSAITNRASGIARALGRGMRFVFQPKAGIPVDEHVALTYSAVWACTRIICDSIAMLSWHVHRIEGSSRFVDRDHPLDFVIYRQPNDEVNSFIFRETLQAHALHWGNGYATEVARELVRIGFQDLGHKRLIAMTHPDNKGSIRVIEKSGFQFEREVELGKGPRLIFGQE